jgi:hemerythrin
MPPEPAMTDAARNPSAAESQQTLDNEHLVQLGLADAVVEAVRHAEPAASVTQLMHQFVDYTELHFMSEQLLMRRHAYPAYAEHAADHAAMIEQLHRLRDEFDRAGGTLTAERALQLKGQLMGHIRNRDAALHAFFNDLQHA